MAIPTVITPSVVELSFPNIIDPNKADAEVDPGKWTTVAWFDKDDAKMEAQVREMFDLAVKEKWGTKPKGKFRDLELLDGDEETYVDGDGEEQPQAPGKLGFRLKTARRPVVVDKYGNTVEKQADLGFNPKAQVKYQPYPYDNKFGKGVTMSCEAFKIVEFGSAGSVATADGFEFEDPIDEA